MVEIAPLKGKAALLTDEFVVAKAAKMAGLRPVVEVTEGSVAGIEPGRPVFWLFMGPPERVWAIAERAGGNCDEAKSGDEVAVQCPGRSGGCAAGKLQIRTQDRSPDGAGTPPRGVCPGKAVPARLGRLRPCGRGAG
ncbi:hypothetical protein SAMN00808754_1418 [Thermanaeromonas toyohensis ToBE]|uniref:Uncharacterized protein n=1 Tax=Thermanaeromonas toyohensis ToBE TaxID=698762 RepID=A0A1W1VSH5_9FIRM|nr:hypothetical protein [Thermanaeromonas toyohensis]SMB96180.1 hypothetical protein SAMN00808754_1418 [Thermanaeromonas toyohensis ToBE]